MQRRILRMVAGGALALAASAALAQHPMEQFVPAMG